jgi:phosphate:Na+ symporter
MDLENFSVIGFLGALAIFIYGIRLARSGVRLLAADRLRSVIAGLTNNRFIALGVGALTTIILQSSNATSISLVGFAATGTMTLAQTMGVLLGADLGTTLVVILLAIESISNYALILLLVGISVDLISSRKRSHYISMLLIGFGFVFFGMKLMVMISSPLREEAILHGFFAFSASRPLLAFAVTTLFTVMVQNSAAPIGLAMVLSFSGLIDITTAVPIVLGANVGTCSGSIIASLRSNVAGRRVALAHLSLKIIGAALALIFIDPFISSVMWVGTILSHQVPVSVSIALSHLLFNLYLVILFLPFIRPASWCIEKILPEPHGHEDEKFRPRYLDHQSLNVPSIAFANVKREIQRMLDITISMFSSCLQVFEKNDRILLEHIQDQDDQVDILERETKFYLALLSQEDLTEEQAHTQLRLLSMSSKLEEIGDTINRNILKLADKKIRTGSQFSKEGWKELLEFHTKIVESFKLASASLASEDSSLARKLIRHHEQLLQLEDEYRQGHLQRLHAKKKEAFDTSSIHLDLLANLYRIDELLVRLVQQAYPHLE